MKKIIGLFIISFTLLGNNLCGMEGSEEFGLELELLGHKQFPTEEVYLRNINSVKRLIVGIISAGRLIEGLIALAVINNRQKDESLNIKMNTVKRSSARILKSAITIYKKLLVELISDTTKLLEKDKPVRRIVSKLNKLKEELYDTTYSNLPKLTVDTEKRFEEEVSSLIKETKEKIIDAISKIKDENFCPECSNPFADIFGFFIHPHQYVKSFSYTLGHAVPPLTHMLITQNLFDSMTSDQIEMYQKIASKAEEIYKIKGRNSPYHPSLYNIFDLTIH